MRECCRLATYNVFSVPNHVLLRLRQRVTSTVPLTRYQVERQPILLAGPCHWTLDLDNVLPASNVVLLINTFVRFEIDVLHNVLGASCQSTRSEELQ